MNKKTILIVDDNVDLLSAMKNTLADKFNVLTAADADMAKSLLSANISVVISDVRLDENNPDNTDGLFVLQEIQHTHPHMPVIMMTGYGNLRLQEKIRQLGAFDYLPKPINIDELENMIQKALIAKQKTYKDFIRKYLVIWIPPVVFFLIFIVSWQLITGIFNIPSYLIPSPKEIVVEIFRSAPNLLKNTLITLFESLFGFLLGSAFGFIMAVGFAHSNKMEKSVYPYMIALKAIPLVAIAPLLILWFGNGVFGKVVMAALMCFFPTIVNTTIGLKSVEMDSLYLMQSLSATKWQIFKKLRLPASMPYFFSALKISSTLAVVGAIVAELSGADRGIGYLILMSSYRMETITLFAAIFAASISGIGFFAAISLLEKKFLYWHDSTLPVA